MDGNFRVFPMSFRDFPGKFRSLFFTLFLPHCVFLVGHPTKGIAIYKWVGIRGFHSSGITNLLLPLKYATTELMSASGQLSEYSISSNSCVIGFRIETSSAVLRPMAPVGSSVVLVESRIKTKTQNLKHASNFR